MPKSQSLFLIAGKLSAINLDDETWSEHLNVERTGSEAPDPFHEILMSDPRGHSPSSRGKADDRLNVDKTGELMI